MNSMWIYCITNKIDGKKYIGQTTRNTSIRWKEHRLNLRKNKHENLHLQNAWNKYGEDIFEFDIITSSKSQTKLDKLEAKLIIECGDNSYNLRSGGRGGVKFNQESRKRMSDAQKIKHINDGGAGVRSAANALKIRWNTDEQFRIEQTKLRKDRWNNNEYRAKCVKNLDITPELKSIYSKQTWNDVEYRKKFEKHYGKIKSPDGVIYDVTGIRRFSREHDLDPSSLINVFNKKSKQYKGWILYGN